MFFPVALALVICVCFSQSDVDFEGETFSPTLSGAATACGDNSCASFDMSAGIRFAEKVTSSGLYMNFVTLEELNAAFEPVMTYNFSIWGNVAASDTMNDTSIATVTVAGDHVFAVAIAVPPNGTGYQTKVAFTFTNWALATNHSLRLRTEVRPTAGQLEGNGMLLESLAARLTNEPTYTSDVPTNPSTRPANVTWSATGTTLWYTFQLTSTATYDPTVTTKAYADSSSGLTTSEIILIVVGGALVILILLGVIVFCVCNRSKIVQKNVDDFNDSRGGGYGTTPGGTGYGTTAEYKSAP